MNPKIEKLKEEKQKNIEKINGWQNKIANAEKRNEEIDRKILEYENTDIIGMIRSSDLTIEEIQSVMKIYRGKSQCTNRARHSSDYAEIKKYIEDNSESDDKQNEEPKTVDDDLE